MNFTDINERGMMTSLPELSYPVAPTEYKDFTYQIFALSYLKSWAAACLGVLGDIAELSTDLSVTNKRGGASLYALRVSPKHRPICCALARKYKDYNVIYQFFLAPVGIRLSELNRIRLVSVIADTETEARAKLGNLPYLVFFSRRPSGRATA